MVLSLLYWCLSLPEVSVSSAILDTLFLSKNSFAMGKNDSSIGSFFISYTCNYLVTISIRNCFLLLAYYQVSRELL